VAGGAGWISGWETCDARVWKSESDGQHIDTDPDVQRQFRVEFENTDVKQRAVTIRDVRRNLTTWGEVVCEVVGFYGMDPSTTSWVAAELRVL